MEYKEIINEFVTNRYTYLHQCATNVLKNNTFVEPEDLIAELYIYLNSNQDKVDGYLKINRLEAFAVSWMSIQGRYRTSQVNTKYGNRFEELNDDITINQLEDCDMVYEIDKDDYEKDLMSIFNEEQIKKIMTVDKIIDKLDKTDMVLFKAYFIDDLSYDKICKKYTFFKMSNGKKITYKSKKSIYTMMKALKEKIQKLIDDDTNY